MLTKRVEKSWGYEEIIYNGSYCCKKLVYTKPGRSSLHYHREKHETFVVARGIFEIERKGLKYLFAQGDAVVLPPYTKHRVTCLQAGFIVEASTHDDPEDCVRLEASDQ